MKLIRDTLPDRGIGAAFVRGWECWTFAIQLGARLWAVEW